MTRLVLRRLLLGVLTLCLVSIIIFAATQALPGDAAIVKLARDQNPVARAALRAHFHLNQPVITQYVSWLGDIVRGNLGTSFASGQPVTTLIGGSVGNTLVLVALASLMGFPLALLLGIGAAVKRDTVTDHVATIGLLTVAAVPEFVLGIGLILLLATRVLHIFPPVSVLNPGQSPLQQLNLVILPAITLALTISPYVGRMIRASMIEVMESDYVAMARLKGLPERRVVLKHALINGSGPTIQASAIALAYLAGGVVVVEQVFRYPGLGTALIGAVQARDIPVVQAVTLIFATVYVVVNIGADLLTVAVTPRLRSEMR